MKKMKKIYVKYRQAIYTIISISLLLLTLVFVWHMTHPHMQSDKEKLRIATAEVGRLIILPKNEQPTLASVVDKAKLNDKFLSTHAETGDQVLIYAKNHMVIIYRPSINKIAAVGTVSADPAYTEAQGSTLTVLDSINSPDKTQKIINAIKSAYPDIKVTSGGTTNRQDFPYTTVVDNTGNKSELRAALMKAVGGKQGFLPSSEDAVNTDFLIIVGQD